jgi:hypothetical protein
MIANQTSNVFGASLSRRGFVQAGGALLVGFRLAAANGIQNAAEAVSGNTLNAALPQSWIEIHADSTILLRVGKPDFGTGSVFTAYRQIAAEELSVPFEAITTVVAGDTDRTPDGSGAFDFLGGGMPNIRKAAAYVHQALLDLASRQLGVSKDHLLVKDGVVSGGGKSVSYGDLVKNQKLNLTIPVKGDIHSMFGLTVDGNPPLKPVSDYTVIGKSFTNSVTVSKVTAKETWVTDVRLPGMLHARMVHPKTLGSKLVSVGALDKVAFPECTSGRKGQFGRRGCANRMGSHQGRATGGFGYKVDGMEGTSDTCAAISIPEGRRGLEEHTATNGRDVEGRCAGCPGKIGKEAFRDISAAVPEACADRAGNRGRRRASRWCRVRLHPHAKSASSALSHRAHAFHFCGPRCGAHVRGSRSLRTLQWRQRRGRG